MCSLLLITVAVTIFIFLSGVFTSLAAIFQFKRRLGFYLLQQFIPTILIVTLSWVGFWIDERSVPARVSLGITTVLALTTLIFGIEASLPRVGYVKAIDVFLLGSFLFVFAALVEYAIICTFSKAFSTRALETSNQKLFQSRGSPHWEINGKENATLHREQEKIEVDFVYHFTVFS